MRNSGMPHSPNPPTHLQLTHPSINHHSYLKQYDDEMIQF